MTLHKIQKVILNYIYSTVNRIHINTLAKDNGCDNHMTEQDSIKIRGVPILMPVPIPLISDQYCTKLKISPLDTQHVHYMFNYH